MIASTRRNVITAIRKTLTATAVVALVVSVSAACGTVENLTAGQKIDRAFEKLGKEKSVGFELDLDTDAATLKSIDPAASPDEQIPDEFAELITAGQISVSVESKKPLAESGQKDFVGMAAKVSGADGELVEYRTVGDFTYARFDLAAFAKLSGSPSPSVDDMLPPGELAESRAAIEKALKGEWVKVSNKKLEEIQKKVMEEAPKEAAEPTLDAKTQKKLLDAVTGVLTSKVEFKTAEGKDGAERVTATASLRALVTAMVEEIRPLAKDLPPGVELPTAKELKELPTKKGSADFTLKNGELKEVSIDLSQLDKKLKGKKIDLVLRLTDAEKPEAPAAATELKLDELMDNMFGGGAAGFPSEEFSG
ncbi:hypothetical protein ACIP88_03895 [Streptomyces uncialis]|uniref:hypothetical protein n=1 Tax=Streptomyces uncialis TaxID=1048205 RepID=UPI0038187E22